jgi:predicted GIY-YIG superfamily endonuclease
LSAEAVAADQDAIGRLRPYATATLQHIALLKRKQERLRAAQIDAERQFLHSVAAAWAAGDLDTAGLAEALRAYRAVAAPGFMGHWDAALPVSAAKLLTWPDSAPNGPAGSWEGTYPIGVRDPAPRRNICVVYVLFDAANQPCYVGSTSTFRDRLARHQRDGKLFVRWTAYPCKDREAAYQLEVRLLEQHKPYLNKKRGR